MSKSSLSSIFKEIFLWRLLSGLLGVEAEVEVNMHNLFWEPAAILVCFRYIGNLASQTLSMNNCFDRARSSVLGIGSEHEEFALKAPAL